MNFFDKIKNFFKNIGKKQQALPEAQMQEEIIDEVGDTVTSEESPSIEESSVMPTSDKGKFKEGLRFDPEDLLDPRVCIGDNFVPNILKSLGVDDAILSNPQLIEEIRPLFMQCIKGWAFRPESNPENGYTRSEIKCIVDHFNTPGVTWEATPEWLKSTYSSVGWTGTMMWLNKETGELSFYESDVFRNQKDNTYKETRFGIGKEGKTTKTVKGANVENVDTKDAYVDYQYTQTSTYNKDGIEMEKDYIDYAHSTPGSAVETISRRDEQYPFAMKEETYVYPDIGTPKESKYVIIDPENLAELNPKNIRNCNNQVIGKASFDDRELLGNYYENNKEEINGLFKQEPKKAVSKVKQALKAGLNKLGLQSGLLEKEQQTELSE